MIIRSSVFLVTLVTLVKLVTLLPKFVNSIPVQSDDVAQQTPAGQPFLFGPPPQTSTLATTSAASVITVTATKTQTEIQTLTQAPTTVTITAKPSTVVSVSTVFETTPRVPTTWSMPPQITDLSSFNVSSFPGGRKNLQFVDGIPADASATRVNAAAATLPADQWDNSTTALQLFYPAGSIDPARKPKGGVDFYATPLPLEDARNVTLEYSAFFPQDFDWVKAGKLPGLYGGHTGCSGGDAALDCFSTRLMWRQDGHGELYLYAPKDKQTNDLCNDKQSVCDASYGFSIGRGSFRWAAGAWTSVRQTVVLNTPGKQDGGFTLDVNGARVIDRSDVFYRDVPTEPKHHDDDDGDGDDDGGDDGGDDDGDDDGGGGRDAGGGGLGGLLGGILNIADTDGSGGPRLELVPHGAQMVLEAVPRTVATMTEVAITTTTYVTHWQPAPTIYVMAADAQGGVVDVGPDGTAEIATNDVVGIESTKDAPARPVPFIGALHTSTFFGGHTKTYATPRDQYVWFKDFALSNNS